MTVIKKRDVKEYFASRKRGGIHLFRSTSQPDATGFSGEEAASADVKSEQSIGNAAAPQPSNGISIVPTEDVSSATESLKKVDFRSAQS